MKKGIISLCVCSLFGMSSLSYATTMAAPDSRFKDSGAVMTNKPRFEFTAGALYLQPSSSNLDYAVLGYPFPVLSPHWDVQAVDPSYTLGFDLRGRYYIPSTDYDVVVSWDHLNTDDSDFTQVASDSGQFVVFPFQAGPSFGQSINNPSQKARSNVKFYYDVVDADVGKNFNFGPNTAMRLFVGLSAARLKQTISTTFGDNADTFSINSTNNSKFTGIGPLIGVDGNYMFDNGIGFFGTLAGSALVGHLDASTDYTSSSPQLTAAGIPINSQSISPDESTQGIPSIDGKLGVDYQHSVSQYSIFTASLGYEYATYFNAIATYNPSLVASNVNTGSIALSSLAKTMSNYTVQGPFINFGFKIS